MPEPIESVMLAGNGLLRWPGKELRIHYRLTVGLDCSISRIDMTPQDAGILWPPNWNSGLYLQMPEGRRLALNVAPNGHVSPNGPLQRSLDGQDWWPDEAPWLPFETTDRVTLSMKLGSIQVFESHRTEEEAEESYRHWKTEVDVAEIRPPFGRPIRL
jgi:hypothetical protein